MRPYSNSNQQTFLELVRAGLWEKEAQLSKLGNIDYDAILQLAEEQSVVGLVTAGLERVVDIKVPQIDLLQFIGSTLQIEQQNKAMNEFVAWLIDYLRKKDVYTLLVKGQGIAQCYERPLWRSSGDVDLFLSDSNYEKSKNVLIPLASDVEKEFQLIKHLGMTINGYSVELHGTLRSRLTKRIDREIDNVQDECFLNGEVRSWQNEGTQIFLPGVNQDVIFVFTHILHHLFIEGIGLRQICDWCRLLWTYRDVIDKQRLEKHLRIMGLMTEWRVLSSLSVNWLGMPAEAMPLYKSGVMWKKKADLLIRFIIESGNFGHNMERKDGWIGTAVHRTSLAFKLMPIFPIDAWKMYIGIFRSVLILKSE